jgi:hypothetical protein
MDARGVRLQPCRQTRSGTAVDQKILPRTMGLPPKMAGSLVIRSSLLMTRSMKGWLAEVGAHIAYGTATVSAIVSGCFDLKRESPSQTSESERDGFNLKLSRLSYDSLQVLEEHGSPSAGRHPPMVKGDGS